MTIAPPQISRSRQAVYGRAAVATSQPLASLAGLQTLSAGGTAADAAIAIGAVLAVTEPPSNGLGGDVIALHYNAKTRQVVTLLGVGRSPAALTFDTFTAHPSTPYNPHTATVPGAVAAWCDLHARFGTPSAFPLSRLFAPAISAARNGFYVHRTTASIWHGEESFLQSVDASSPFLPAPQVGSLFRNPDVAAVLEGIAAEGRDAFYKGRVAEAIVNATRKHGSLFSLDDLARHETVFTEPLSTTYRDWRVYEAGPPTHGAIALLALNLLQKHDVASMSSETRTHVLIDCLRLAFNAGASRIGDSSASHGAIEDILTDDFAQTLSKSLDTTMKSVLPFKDDGPLGTGGTVQFAVVDGDGNAVSVVQSNYCGFGIGITPAQCGFTIQCRGLNFSRVAGHVNSADGGKRPYHTIIPGMMVRTGRRGQMKEVGKGVDGDGRDGETEGKEGDDVVAFGVMGSFMQPQGHTQVVSNIVDRGMDPQQALNETRFRVTGKFCAVECGSGNDAVLVEDDMDRVIVEELVKRGHDVRVGQASKFGRGQVCWRRGSDGRVAAGTEVRADGMALIL